MEIKATDVKALRDATGAGMMDAKKALQDAGGDVDAAKKLLRERGMASAAKLSERMADEGVVESYLHQPDPTLPPKVGVLVELNCSTDFVAKTEGFRDLARALCLHIAAANPTVVTREELPTEMVEGEREIIAKQARDSGKPDNIVEKIVEGRLAEFYKIHCLVDQVYVRDDSMTIGQMLDQAAGEMKEPVRVRRFARFRVGA